jgi:hypothetical protein
MSPHELDEKIKRLILSVKNNLITKRKAINSLLAHKEDGFSTTDQSIHNHMVKKIDHAVEVLNRF